MFYVVLDYVLSMQERPIAHKDMNIMKKIPTMIKMVEGIVEYAVDKSKKDTSYERRGNTIIEKPLIMMLFMYSVSFGILGVEFLGCAFDIELTNMEGTPINGCDGEGNLSEMINMDALNARTLNIVNTNQTTITTDPIIAAAGIALQIFLLLTGTLVFNIMILFGVPFIFVSGLVILYLIMLARTLVALLRGI